MKLIEPEMTAGPNRYEQRNECPCCGTPVSRAKLRVASRPAAESLSPEEHGKFLSGYTSERVFFSYHECGGCGAYYCPTYYSQEQLNRLYGRQAENMAEAPLAARQRTQQSYAKLLIRHSRMAGGFLEIGCDIGLFAEICARAGTFDHFWLYEPNREVHDQLAGRFEGYQYTIRDTNFAPADVPSRSVSTAVMIHVLDHLLNPRQFLSELYNCLEPKGILFVVTHDTQSALARLLGHRWPPYTLQHPHLFSARSMRSLFSSAGYEVVDIVKTTNFFPLTYLLRAGMSVVGVPQSFVPTWQRPLIGLPLGNIAAIVRRP